MSMNLIEFKDVSMDYLDINYNLIINEFDKVLLKGINGKGKTTLVKLITKYIKPNKGICINNTSSIYYLEENFTLPGNMKVITYIKLIEYLKNGRVSEFLFNEFKIPTKKLIKDLSKGNKQKLALLTLFIGNCSLYVLDEPLNGLDSKSRDIFLKYLFKLKNITIIFISHLLNSELTYFNKLIEL